MVYPSPAVGSFRNWPPRRHNLDSAEGFDMIVVLLILAPLKLPSSSTYREMMQKKNSLWLCLWLWLLLLLLFFSSGSVIIPDSTS